MSSKKKKVVVAASRSSETHEKSSSSANANPLVFGKETYKWLGLGIGLVVIGLLLMIGGFNENPNVWDESGIYGFRRTVLAPIVILAGLGVNVFALFK